MDKNEIAHQVLDRFKELQIPEMIVEDFRMEDFYRKGSVLIVCERGEGDDAEIVFRLFRPNAIWQRLIKEVLD